MRPSLPGSQKGKGFRRVGFKKNFKQKSKNPAIPKTRKELRKEERMTKKAEKHTYLLKRFGKEPEPVPKKKRRQQKKKKSKVKSGVQEPKNEKHEFDRDSDSGNSDYDSRPLKIDEDKLKLEMEAVRKKRLIEDNDQEDRTIRSLQKKLKLNKKAQVPASFRVDGLDYLLDFCNELETKSPDGKAQKKKSNMNADELDEDDDDQDSKDEHSSSEASVEDLDDENSHNDDDDDDAGQDNLESNEEEDDNENDDADDDFGLKASDVDFEEEANELDSDSEGHLDLEESEREKNELWEDIYGRMRDKAGNVVKDTDVQPQSSSTISPAAGVKYVPPMKRQSQQRDKIQKSLKGLFNRLSESNMHSIATQIESFYMENSRNEMNETLLELLSAVLLGPILNSDRIILEHVMLIAILHANIGTEVGAFFIQSFVQQFHELYQAKSEHTEGKKLENIILIVSYMYHFKIVNSCLIYDILNLLGKSFEAKDVEIILTILRSIGFRLRKDDPASLKSLIQLLQQKATQAQTAEHGSRVKFMLEILLAIRNNNMTKIPNYDPSFGEHLIKIVKTFIHKGNYVSELKISLQDLLNADTKGRWWILGAAWTNSTATINEKGDEKLNSSSVATNTDKTGELTGNKKLMRKAKKLGMNTETRRSIFYILMTAEDYTDAYEKLVHLGLKNQPEREIIHVLIYCCLHEKKFNPYYALITAKFCALDRRFMLTTQYTIWDRLKEFPDPVEHHLKNLTALLISLIKDKSVPLTILKVIDFSDMPPWKLTFLKEVLAGILLQSKTEILEEIFIKPGLSEKLQLFRDSLKVFMNHFMLNEDQIVTLDGETSTILFSEPTIKQQLAERIELAEKALALGHSKVQF